MRPSWDEYFMEIAKVVATRATCDRKHVGAVIVDGRNRIVSTGYNGSARGLPHCDDAGHALKEIDGRLSCVPADTIVSKFLSGRYNSRHRTIGQIYEMWQDFYRSKGVKLMKLRSANEAGVIVPGKITDVWRIGERKTYEVSTFLGRHVRTTEDHQFLTPDGWRRLDSLNTQSQVALNGQPLYEDVDWLKARYAEGLTIASIADLCNVSSSLIRKRFVKNNIERRPRLWKKGVGGPGKGWNKGLTHGGSGTYAGRDVQVTSARERARRYALASRCVVCESREKLQVHHLDNDPYNDSLSNLVTLCTACHALAHTPHAKRETIVFDQVVSIGKPKTETVYDITVEPFHNFVGNGFILHNCVRTLHAESNALDDAGRRADGGTLYVTVIPCYDCAKRIINAGIRRVVYGEFYESRNTDMVQSYFKSANVPLVRIW